MKLMTNLNSSSNIDDNTAKNFDELHDELCDHLEFSIKHGGFSLGPFKQGGCSCEICSYLRSHLVLKYYIKHKEWPKGV